MKVNNCNNNNNINSQIKFNFDFNYIYITFIFIFILYRSLHLLYTFIHMFVLYAFVFIFIIIASCCLCNVCICCLAIYLLMNLLYCIWLLHLIAIFDICHCYSWDLSYICMMSIIWYSLLSFTLICTWHFLYIGIWLSFSWPAHFDRAYSKVLNTACH